MNEIELQEKLDNAIDTFRTEINEIQKELLRWKENENKGKWKPADEDIYWFRDSRGAIINEFFNCEHWGHNWREKNIPIFETREECERYWHFMDTVKEKSYEFSEEEWEDSDKPKCYIEYTYSLKSFDVLKAYCCKQIGNIYFKTAKDARYIIDNYKEELLKYWI